jgi:hypothetical protein
MTTRIEADLLIRGLGPSPGAVMQSPEGVSIADCIRDDTEHLGRHRGPRRARSAGRPQHPEAPHLEPEPLTQLADPLRGRRAMPAAPRWVPAGAELT